MSTRLLSSRFVASAFAVVAFAGLAAPAHAQREGMRTAPFEMPVVAPGNSVGGEFMLGTMEPSPVADNATEIAFELFGTFEITDRLSLRGRLPLAYTSADNGHSSLGNISAGIDYLLNANRSGSNATAWSIGGALSLPTAADSGGSLTASTLHGIYRVPYPGRYLPNTTTIRLYGQFRLDARKVFLQLQGGLNHWIIDRRDDLMLLRFGAALGVAAGRSTTLIGELTFLSDFLNDTNDDWWTNLDLGARFRVGNDLRLGVRLFVPLDRTSRDYNILGAAVDLRSQF